MKKLFLILGAASLTATTSSIVIACGTNEPEKWDKIKFSDRKIYNTLILNMLNSDLITRSQADIFFGISESDQITDIMKMINKVITDSEYTYTNQTKSDLFKLLAQQDSSTEQILDNLATTIVYNDYTTKMLQNNGTSVGDSTFGKRALNPSNLVNGDSNYSYAIYFQEADSTKWLRWQYSFEFDNKFKQDQTPSLALLSADVNATNSNKAFRIVGTKKTSSSTQAMDVLPTTSIALTAENIPADVEQFVIEEAFSGFEIMKYRFQNYISSEIKPTLYDQLIGMAYLNDSILATNTTTANYTKTAARLNTTNKLVTSFQNRLNEGQEANIKMIWSIRNQGTTSQISTWISQIKTAMNDTTQDGNIRVANGALTGVLKTIMNNQNTDIANITEQGYDNFFGLRGYNGIVRDTDAGIEALTSQEITIATEAQTAVANINAPTILTNNGNGFSVEDGRVSELVLVVPLYLNDLYSYHDINIMYNAQTSQNEVHIPHDTWITLSDKAFNYTNITSVEAQTNVVVAQDNDHNFYLKLADGDETGTVLINNASVNVIPSDELTTLGVHGTIDKTATSFTSAFSTEEQNQFNDGDQIVYQVNFTRTTDPVRNFTQIINWENSINQSTDVRNLTAQQKQTLLDQIINGIIAKDSTYIDEAKTVLYTKYIISGDVVLYQGLYDQISQFIKEDEDESSD